MYSFFTTRHRIITKMVNFTARGLMPPVFTPLNDDLTINCGAIPSYAEYLIKAGIQSVLVGGTTSEHMSLSVPDRKKIIDAWVKVGKTTGLHIQAQVGGAPLPDVLELAKYCAANGVDSILTLPEIYYRPSTISELVHYVGLVAKAAPNLPILYYHIPRMNKVEINTPAFIKEATSQIPNFKGLKYSLNDLCEGAQVLRCLKDDQEMFLGNAALLAPAALLGVKSSIGTMYNFFPKLAFDILEAVKNNEVAKARDLQEKLSLAIEAITSEGSWVPTMKVVMELVSGLKMGPPSLPQQPISQEARKRIEGKLRNLALL